MEAIPAAREEQSRGPSSPERTSSLELRGGRHEGRGEERATRPEIQPQCAFTTTPRPWPGAASLLPALFLPGKAGRRGPGRGRGGPWRWGWGRPAPARDSWRNGARARTRGLAGLQRLCFGTPSPIASLDGSGGRRCGARNRARGRGEQPPSSARSSGAQPPGRSLDAAAAVAAGLRAPDPAWSAPP